MRLQTKKGIYPAPLFNVKSGAGFTLIEVLLYAALLSLFFGFSIVSTINIFSMNRLFLERTEVLQNQEFIRQKIKWAFHQAREISVPSPNLSSATNLTLTAYDSSLNPISFSFSSSSLLLSLSGGELVPLEGGRVRVASFLADHRSSSQTSSTLMVTIGLQSRQDPRVSSTVVYSLSFP